MRDQWLNRAVCLFRPAFRRAGYPLPRRLTVCAKVCSNPLWYGESYGWHMAVVSDRVELGKHALLVLAHELSHIALHNKYQAIGMGHNEEFCKLAHRIGLNVRGECPPTEKFNGTCNRWCEKLGPYR